MTLPLWASSAYTVPSCVPKKTRPPSTIGEDSLGLGRACDHSGLPVAASTATIAPASTPGERSSTVA